MTIQILTLIVSLLFVFSSLLASKEPEMTVSAEVDETAIPFEGKATLTYRVEWEIAPGTSSVLFTSAPTLRLEKLRMAGVSSRVAPFTRGGKSFVAREFVYTLVPTKPGRGQAHPAMLEYILLPDSTPGSLSAPALSIQVASPIAEKGFVFSWWLILLAICAVVATGVGLVALAHRRQKSRDSEETPDLSMKEKLAQLKSATARSRGEFYTALAEFIYEIVTARYGQIVRKGDPEELCASLRSASAPEALVAELGKYLTVALREKYTPGVGAPGEALRAYSEFESFYNSSWLPQTRRLAAAPGWRGMAGLLRKGASTSAVKTR